MSIDSSRVMNTTFENKYKIEHYENHRKYKNHKLYSKRKISQLKKKVFFIHFSLAKTVKFWVLHTASKCLFHSDLILCFNVSSGIGAD